MGEFAFVTILHSAFFTVSGRPLAAAAGTYLHAQGNLTVLAVDDKFESSVDNYSFRTMLSANKASEGCMLHS